VILANGRLDRLNGRAFDMRETCVGKPFSLAKLIGHIEDALPSPIAGSA